MGMCQGARAVDVESWYESNMEVRGSTFAEEGFSPDLITHDTERSRYYSYVLYDGVEILEALCENYCDHHLSQDKYWLHHSPPFNDIRAANDTTTYDILQQLRKARAKGLIKSREAAPKGENLVVTCVAEEPQSGQEFRRSFDEFNVFLWVAVC